MIEQPILIDSPEMPAAITPQTSSWESFPRVMSETINNLSAALKDAGLKPEGPLFVRYLEMSSEKLVFEVGFPIAGPVPQHAYFQAGSLPEARVIRTVYTGPYDGLFQAWQAFDEVYQAPAFQREHGMKPRADFWECYLVGPHTESNPNAYQTELCRPLEPVLTQPGE